MNDGELAGQPGSVPVPDGGMPVEPGPETTAARWIRRHRRTLLWGSLGLGSLLVAWTVGVPWVRNALNTVSTDDAYVNGHFTSVAPRVEGQVARVLVDDNMRVRQGQLLVQLDREPFQVVLDQKLALLGVAEANLRQAEAQVRALEGTARSKRWTIEYETEQVKNQVAALQSAAALLESRRATVSRARADYQRAEALFSRNAVSREELDMRRESIRVAEANAEEALAQAQKIRVSLGLPPSPPQGRPITDVPPDLDQNFSSVRVALAGLVQTVAQLGLPLAGTNDTPRQYLEKFRKLDANGDIDAILERLVKDAPGYKRAQANVEQARRDVAQAELNLRYCDIVAEIDGVVARRNVNPGNYVRVAQGLMAIRSVQDIWIDANFKETQLSDLRIGQPVDLYVDMYGEELVYKGRVSGFTMGTGSTLALLPPQNATGNFVKVVQRLPVRIDLVDGNPEDHPLFIGLSVVPYVRFKEAPTGPDAGKFLQDVNLSSTAGQAPGNGGPRQADGTASPPISTHGTGP